MAPAQARVFQPFLYLHVLLVSAITGFVLLVWLTLFYSGLKLLWENDFVESNSWIFPVICLPFSLIVGLLVKYVRAPTAMTESMTDSLAGDTSHIEWRRFPVSVAQSLASLFSGAAIGPEGALGLLASQIAAWYNRVLKVPSDRQPKLVYASVASAYNGLLQNPLFSGVLAIELSETKETGRTSLPANLIGGAVGYAIFRVVGSLVDAPSLAGMLGLQPVQHIGLADPFLIILMALVGIGLAAIAGVIFKIAAKAFGRVRNEVVRALAAGVIFSIVGWLAPVLMFSGESQVLDLVKDPASYGVALLLLIGVAKLALLAVGFRSGFLGGAIFPSIFAMVSVALAVDLLIPGAEQAILVAGVMAGFMVVTFRTPFMVILLIAYLLEANFDMLTLIVLAVAVALIVSPLLQLLMTRRAAAQAQRQARGTSAGRDAEAAGSGETRPVS